MLFGMFSHDSVDVIDSLEGVLRLLANSNWASEPDLALTYLIS
jgi:hypothetical protein